MRNCKTSGTHSRLLLSQALETHPALLNPDGSSKISIPVSGYIDAVEKGKVTALEHAPKGSAYHYNVYQNWRPPQWPDLGPKYTFVQGGNVSSQSGGQVVNDNVDDAEDGGFAFNTVAMQRNHTNLELKIAGIVLSPAKGIAEHSSNDPNDVTIQKRFVDVVDQNLSQ